MPISARDGFGLRPDFGEFSRAEAAARCGSVGTECAKQDAYVKSPRVRLRPAFLGQYQGSVRLIATFVGRIKQSQFAVAAVDAKRRQRALSMKQAGHAPVETNPMCRPGLLAALDPVVGRDRRVGQSPE